MRINKTKSKKILLLLTIEYNLNKNIVVHLLFNILMSSNNELYIKYSVTNI